MKNGIPTKQTMNRMRILQFVYNNFLQITKKVANPFSISTHEYIRPLSCFSIHECKLNIFLKWRGKKHVLVFFIYLKGKLQNGLILPQDSHKIC